MADVFEFKAISETAYEIGLTSVSSSLDGKKYTASKVSEWTESIGSECLARLRTTSPNFKVTLLFIFLPSHFFSIHAITRIFYVLLVYCEYLDQPEGWSRPPHGNL